MESSSKHEVVLTYDRVGKSSLTYEVDDEIVKEIRKLGTYDFYVLYTLLDPRFEVMFRPLTTIIDIGANIGSYAIPLGKLVANRDGGNVVAVEGSRATGSVHGRGVISPSRSV